MMPGKNPNKVKIIFIQKCLPKPTCRNTPRGGSIIANIRRMMSIKNSLVFIVLLMNNSLK